VLSALTYLAPGRVWSPAFRGGPPPMDGARKRVDPSHTVDSETAQSRLQNGPDSPTSSKISLMRSVEGLCHSRSMRPAYHSLASLQHWSSDRTPPGSRPRISHQFATCSSDRKTRIVAHVNPTFSQNRRGGTAKWTTASRGWTCPERTLRVMGSWQSAQWVGVSVSTPRSTGIARASHAQLAQ